VPLHHPGGASTEGLPSFFDMDTFGDDGGGGSLPAFFTLEDDVGVPAVPEPTPAAQAQAKALAGGLEPEDGRSPRVVGPVGACVCGGMWRLWV
jgi:hypothetical protein